MNEDAGFDGFITRDGELVSIQETEKVSAIFLKTEDLDHAVGILWHLEALLQSTPGPFLKSS